MSNPFKVGDTIKFANEKQWSDATHGGAYQKHFKDAEQLHIVRFVKDNYVGVTEDGEAAWMYIRFNKVDVEPALKQIAAGSGPNLMHSMDAAMASTQLGFLQKRQQAWDAYADSRTKITGIRPQPGLAPGKDDCQLMPRAQGFKEGYTQGYARAQADQRAQYEGVLTLAAARSTDPATAHEAARTTRANKITELVYQDLKSNGNASAATVAKRLGIALNTVSPRFATLKKQGRVIVVGGERGEGAAKRSVYGAI